MHFDPGLMDHKRQELLKHYDYRDYAYCLSKTAQELGLFKNAKTERQAHPSAAVPAGRMRIDVLTTIPCGRADFTIVVECKDWPEPAGADAVERSLAAKHAIDAHKAAVVSATGYTSAAVQAAKELGVALWVPNLKIYHIVERSQVCWEPSEADRKKYDTLCNLRAKYFGSSTAAGGKAAAGTGAVTFQKEILDFKLVEFDEGYSDMPFDPCNPDLQCYSDAYFYKGLDGIDFRLVTTKIAAELEVMRQL